MSDDGPAPHRRYYTPAEVSIHNKENDCWVSFLGKVYDLTPLILAHQEERTKTGWGQHHLVEEDTAAPIVEAAGTDISSWFDEKTGQLKTYKHPVTGLPVNYPPGKRFIHCPPPAPVSNWATDFGPAWYKPDPKYCIGNISKKTRIIRVVNTLTHQEHQLEVCSEETIAEISVRFGYHHNRNAESYVWKRLGELLQMDKTLEENGVADDTDKLKKLNVEEEFLYPAIHVYFDDEKAAK
eukprot:TRINITY_DN3042_c0_g1_i2.p1 TRINITY_DN3042_c0_g1~~TRINITY_DN3042_c0_g1_i2.p1  ORF type:complete len:238 (+),score=45.95 TRINITY_DN3042_c0_g1_i2:124-837(+)